MEPVGVGLDGPPVTLMVGVSPELAEVARLLGQQGERIALLSQAEARLREYRNWLVDQGVPTMYAVADVTDGSSALRAFSEIAAWGTRLDRLIYNLSVVSREAAADVTPTVLHQVMGVNFFGFVNCFRLAHPMLRRSGGGHVVAISSGPASGDSESGVAVAASQASLHIYLLALRTELVDEKIQITEVWLDPPGIQAAGLASESAAIVAGILHVLRDRPDQFRLGSGNRSGKSS